jgi:hypothetical protein
MKTSQKAYLAGLLDGDGSILLQLKPRKEMKFLFRVKAVIIFYQDVKYIQAMHQFQKLIGAGYVYQRNDRISELRIEGFKQVNKCLRLFRPYLVFKSTQADLMFEALRIVMKRRYSIEEFLQVCQLADEISQASYTSKRRKYTAKYVATILQQHGLFPVTTGFPPLAE